MTIYLHLGLPRTAGKNIPIWRIRTSKDCGCISGNSFIGAGKEQFKLLHSGNIIYKSVIVVYAADIYAIYQARPLRW